MQGLGLIAVVFVVLVVHFSEENVVGGRAAVVAYCRRVSHHSFNLGKKKRGERRQEKALTPLALDAKENPYPPPKHFQRLHEKDAALQIIEVVQVRAQLDAPRASQNAVYDYSRVIHLLRMEEPMPTQAPRMLRVLAIPFRGEKCEVPIPRYVPIERISRVDDNGEQPQPEQRRFAHPVLARIRAPLQRTKNDYRKRGRVLQCVCQMHAAPARRRTDLPRSSVCPLHAEILNQALSKPDQRGDGYYEGDPECAAAIAVRWTRRRMFRAEEHAQRDEQIAQHFGVTRQRICQQDIAEFPVCRLGDAADGNAFQGAERPRAAVAADEGDGRDEADDEEEEVDVWQDFPGGDVFGGARGEGPEEEEGEGERDGQDGGYTVGGEVVRGVVGTGARWVAD